MRKKIINIEQDFEKIIFHVTGKDNFLHTKKIETNVYELAELLLKFKTENMNDKIYVLQKPTLHLNYVVPIGTEFYLNGDFIYSDEYKICFEKIISENTDWFKLKEEVKPTVVTGVWDKDNVRFYFNENDIFKRKEGIIISRERLAEILVEYSKNPNQSIVDKFKLFTEKEYLQFGEECFNAARTWGNAVKDNLIEWFAVANMVRYKTFSDFMNSKNKQTQ